MGLMGTSYSKPTAQSGSSTEEPGDWRAQMSADSRPRVLSWTLEILKRWHLSHPGDEGLLQEHMEIATLHEEKIFSRATSQTDYLRKISLKILAMETRVHNHMPDSISLNSIISSLKPSNTDDKDGVVVNEAEDINPYKRDPLCEFVGPMTRSRTKRMNSALNKSGER